MAKVPWSSEELAILYQRDASVSFKQLAKFLPGRTPSAIRGKCCHLGLVHRQPWSPEEIAFLEQHSPRMTHQEMATHLPGRSESAVHRKCTKLGIVRGYWHLPAHEELPEVPLVEAVYLAGHFDGEGCITMRYTGTKYSLTSCVTAAHVPVLHKYKSWFGGSVQSAGHRVNKRPSNKPLSRWILFGYYANMFFLETIEPYLLEKKSQAQIAIEFLRLRITASHACPSEDIRQKAAECSHALRVAKRHC